MDVQATLPFTRDGAIPLVVSYGMGVDSTAMLVGYHHRGIRPDKIITADTGSDHPENYAYLETIGAWLKRVGFPEVEVVKNLRPRSGDNSLRDALLRTNVLPALAYGNHQCSLVWKIEPIDKHLRAAYGWSNREKSWADGYPYIQKAIGYDAGARDRSRAARAHGKDTSGFKNCFPLIDWGLDREASIDLIRREGLPVPKKSSCFFCPAMRKDEIVELGRAHPALLVDAVRIEDGALQRGLSKIQGLGRNWNWRRFIEREAPEDIRRILRPFA